MINEQLAQHAAHVRTNVVKMLTEAKSGHPGGSLSIVDILQVLYFETMHIDPKNPKMADRDRFVLSKGHSAPGLYATLVERGFFPEDELWKLRKCNAMLQGHPDMKHTPGVDMSTGSLGQGLSAANGMALAAKLDKADWRVYAICGDGEIQEGQIWEAAMYAGSQELDNLVVLVDDNGMQIDDYTDAINAVRPLDKRWEAFGWATLCIDGHNFSDLEAALTHARTIKKRPTAIIMATVKGKGLSVAEGKLSSHNMPLSPEDVAAALQELQ